MAELEKRQRKELHFMHCPKCGLKPIEIEYRCLEIDRCSKCDGVRLDAGEPEAAVELDQGFPGRIFGL